MLVGARRDLRRMRHRHHLHLGGEPRQPRADGVGHRAADAGIDFVEHQRRRRAAIGQHHLERQQKARKFAAGGDLHQRSRPRAGIGLHPELDAVEAVRAWRCRIAFDLGRELRALELERLEFGIDRLVELLRRLRARGRERLRRRRDSASAASGASRSSFFKLLGAGVDQRHSAAYLRPARRARRPASLYLREAARSANSRSSMRSSSAGSKSAASSAAFEMLVAPPPAR